MIQCNNLVGRISAKESLKGKINNKEVQVYPDLENLVVTPSTEQQTFKSKKYGYDEVTVKGIESEELSVNPTSEEQIFDGVYNKVVVGIGTDSSDATAVSNDIALGKTAYVRNLKVEGTAETVDTRDADATAKDIALGKTAYVNNEKIVGTAEVKEHNAKIDTSVSTAFSIQNCITKVEDIDTTNCTSISFSGCINLEEIPEIDTSKLTSCSSMFYNCKKIVTIPEINTNNATNMSNMFNGCSSLQNIAHIDTSKVTNTQQMFYNCTSLQEISNLDFSSSTTLNSIFYNCSSIKSIELLNTKNVTAINQAFYGCSSLETIKELDCEKVRSTYNVFSGCTAIKNMGGLKNLGKSFNEKSENNYNHEIILKTNLLTYESLMNIINNLYDLNLTYNVANGGTLYRQRLNIGTINLAKLTEEEIKIATDKGWNVV